MFCCFADLNTEQARNYYRMGPEDQYESVGINFFSLDTIVSIIVGMIAVCHVEYEARIILSRDSIDLCHSHAVGRALSEGDEGFSLESLSNRSICFTLVFMMIYGIGTDLVQISRIAKTFSRFGYRFVNRILSSQEVAEFERYRQDKAQFLASR